MSKPNSNIITNNIPTDYKEKLTDLHKQHATRYLAEAEKMLAQGVTDLKQTLLLLCQVASNINKEKAKEELPTLQQACALLVEGLNRSGANWQPLFEQEFPKYEARRELRRQQILEQHSKYQETQHQRTAVK